MGLGVGKGYHKESNLLGDQTKVEGITAAQGKTFGEGTKKATTEVGRIQPVRTSPRASETVDDLVHMLRSRRLGNQANILRPRMSSGDLDSDKHRTLRQSRRSRGCSVGELPSQSSPKVTPKSRTPVGRSAKAAQFVQEDLLGLENGQKKSHLLPSWDKQSGEDIENNNVCQVKVEVPELSCKVCGKICASERGRSIHVAKAHTSEDIYSQCGTCGKEFTQASHKIDHECDQSAHERPFACPLSSCSRTFMQLQHLLNHKKYCHKDSRKILCQTCHLQFSSPEALSFHRTLDYCKSTKSNVHTRTPPSCKARITKENLLQLHLKLKHQEGDDFPDLCSYVSLQESSEEISFKCGIESCFEQFSEISKLLEHEAICRKRKQTTCRNCTKEFETPLDMLLHRISCEQKAFCSKPAPPPSCPNCSREFKRDKFLKNHLKASKCREAFRSYVCDAPNCGKIFEKPVLLRNHLYSHTDSPFHCSRLHLFLPILIISFASGQDVVSVLCGLKTIESTAKRSMMEESTCSIVTNATKCSPCPVILRRTRRASTRKSPTSSHFSMI